MIALRRRLVVSIDLTLPDGGLVKDISSILQPFVNCPERGLVHALKVLENMGFCGHGCDASDAFWITLQAGFAP